MKQIQLVEESSRNKRLALSKPKKSRIVTDTNRWIQCVVNTNVSLYNNDVQWNYVQEAAKIANIPFVPFVPFVPSNILDIGIGLHDESSNTGIFLVEQQIRRKMQGYKAQDIEKHLWDVTQFVDYEYILELLVQSQMNCVYCRKPTMVLYTYVREPKQWTLERMDNSLGHIRGNVQIACLTCNLRRRTMKQERYLLTKQMMHVVKLPEEET